MHGHLVLGPGPVAAALGLDDVLQAGGGSAHTLLLAVLGKELLAGLAGLLLHLGLQILQVGVDELVGFVERHGRLLALESGLYGVVERFVIEFLDAHSLELLAHGQAPGIT